MRGTMITFEPGKPPTAIPFDRAIKLEELKAGIGGGYLEVVPGFTDIAWAGVVMNCIAFCDEDGKRKELPTNDLATSLWELSLRRKGSALMGRDYLVGQIAVVFGDREFVESL